MNDRAEKKSEMPLLVTAAVVLEKGRVLLTKRPEDKLHPGFWEFPGGKVSPGESPEEALCREMIEELGVGVFVDNIFEVVYHCYDWGAVLILAYRCRLRKGPLQNLEVAEHRWVRTVDLPRYKILPADQPIINRLLSFAM